MIKFITLFIVSVFTAIAFLSSDYSYTQKLKRYMLVEKNKAIQYRDSIIITNRKHEKLL